VYGIASLQMHRIGVISDTHNRLDSKVLDIFCGVDLILHAGDVCKTEILEKLGTVAPVVAVLGNNDSLPSLRIKERRELNGVRFEIIHIFPPRIPDDTDWLIFGHTHVPCDETVKGVRLFNPGSAGLANKGAPRSVALLTWDGNKWESEFTLLD